MLVVVLPEGLGSVLSRPALQDLGTTGMFVDELYGCLSASICFCEFGFGSRTGHVVNVILNNEPETVGLILVLSNLSGSICLGHFVR